MAIWQQGVHRKADKHQMAGLGFRVQGLGFRVQGSGFRAYLTCFAESMLQERIFFCIDMRTLQDSLA